MRVIAVLQVRRGDIAAAAGALGHVLPGHLDMDAARMGGYSTVLLDTLDDMEAARTLYEDLGFEEIPPYYHNPHAGAHYLKVDL